MLGETGLYFLYFLRYLGCDGSRMVSGFWTTGILLVHVPPYSSSFQCISPWSATTKSSHHVWVETNLCAASEPCICPGCRKTCMPLRQPYCWSVAWLGPTSHSYTIHCRHWLWLIIVFVFVFELLSTPLINWHFRLESLPSSTRCTSRFLLVAFTYKQYQVEVRGRTFPDKMHPNTSLHMAGFTFNLLLVGMRTICTMNTNFWSKILKDLMQFLTASENHSRHIS
jgi:hypothetical protein